MKKERNARASAFLPVEDSRTTKRMEIVIVCGPPGSGKSTYVLANKWRSDIVWDFDEVMHAITGNPRHSDWPTGALDVVLALRKTFSSVALTGVDGIRRAWIITCSAKSTFVKELRQHGAVVLEMPTPIATCAERLENRGSGQSRLLDRFLASQEQWP